MNAIFRLDANEKIGMGHLSRCMNLASILNKKGVKIQFIFRYLDKRFKKLSGCNKYQVTYLPNNTLFKNIKNLDSEKIWPSNLQKADALATRDLIKNKSIDWLIVDHYGLNFKWEKIIKNNVKKIMVIGDHLDRYHNCDLFLNQNFFDKKKLKIKRYIKDPITLIGPKYSLLDKSYLYLRQKMQIKKDKIKNILISFGGSDNLNLVLKAINVFDCKELKDKNLLIPIDKKFIGNKLKYNKIIKKPKNLSKLIHKADFALGGGGITTWERMCLGLPAIIFPISENQRINSESLKKKKLVYLIKNFEKISIKNFRKKIFKIIKNKDDLYFKKINGLINVDGLGSLRVAEILFPSKSKYLNLRKTNIKDLYTYFNWVNEKEVIKSSFNNKPISIEKHSKWFKGQLKNKKNKMFVMEINKLPIGQIRFNIPNKDAYIDYSLDSAFRNRGWGTKIVSLGIKNLGISRLKKIHAKVKKNNFKSSLIFKNLGFEEKLIQSNYLFTLDKRNIFANNEKR